MSTGIGWTDETWNFILGCERVSKGCTGCYAITTANIRKSHPNEKIATAYAGLVAPIDGRVDWTGQIRVVENRLHLPLSWRKPRRIFVNSMSDLFHSDVPIGVIAEAFAVMALTPQHHYQILTKRHARMRSVLRSGDFAHLVWNWIRTAVTDIPGAKRVPAERIRAAMDHIGGRMFPHHAMPPLPNVWVGVSVEDQATANLRIPALLDTPAAVRWISAEPLLGPVDLTAWIPPRTPMRSADAPTTWADWTWPDWVPVKAREQIESFWSEKVGRGPRGWLTDAHTNGAPAFGQQWTTHPRMRPPGSADEQHHGRYIHAWNNIGRLALPDGGMGYTSFTGRHVRNQLGLHWVVVGGETGPGCRPMHPAWARSLRDQCKASVGTRFFFKQWGDHSPYAPDDWSEDAGGCDAVNLDGSLTWVAGDDDSDLLSNHARNLVDGWAFAHRVGRKAAGNRLDGEVIEEYPAVLGAVE